ncbi:rab effector MyRIP isoform X2 [Scleropages formosus]|uniref:rab effector MyRIP isoform X2 n=1 Tax=Scleropages formosus TaxID=113540 RepID=UPI0008787C33|nr:rab effector MyRIP isoform X2 [Scleropages formosus]
MGRKLDLSGLTDDEAEHVLQVVKRDMKLRKKEEERLSELRQELDEEGSRCSLLSRQEKFNERCCMRCCSPFTFLLNPKRPCGDCRFNVCKGCRTYSKEERIWICSACQKSRILKTQSLEWYYNNVKSRFKRFGSAKVLKTLYRKHVVEQGALSELTEGSYHEGSLDNDESVGSDSAFYKQSEGHSMAETLSVALRVAEEAIEEAIAKAEEYSDSLEKQNEARYLRDNKEELIEELATTIVQKIIQRRKRTELQPEYEMVWPSGPADEPHSPTAAPSAAPCRENTPAVQNTLRSSQALWRSRSAGSLTSDDSPDKPTEPRGKNSPVPGDALWGVNNFGTLRRDSRASPMPSWKSVDRLDNSSASSMLQSPDGNWIALQNSQLGRPSLLTKWKSQVFSALEKESGVVSAYDEMGSDSDGGADEAGWAATLQEFRRRMSDETYYTDSQHDPEWTYTPHPPVTSPSSGQYTNTETLNSDSEASTTPSAWDAPARPRKPSAAPWSKKGPPDHSHHRLHAHPRPDALDVNFNPRTVDSSEAEERQGDPIRRARRRKRSRREQVDPTRSHTPQYSSPVLDYSGFLRNALGRKDAGGDSVGHQAPAFVSTGASDTNIGAPSQRRAWALGRTTLAELECKSKPCGPAGRAKERNVSSSEEDLLRGDPGKRPQEREEGRLEQKEKGRPSEKVVQAKEDALNVSRAENGIKKLKEKEAVLLQMEKALKKRGSEKKRLGEKVGTGGKEPAEKANNHASGKSAPLDPKELRSLEDICKEGQNGVDLQHRLQLLSSLLQQKYSAASLCSITTEVLKVLNATEELIEEASGEGHGLTDPGGPTSPDTKQLDERLTKLEENVYLAAGTVYGLEGDLGDLENCARAIRSATTESELAHLEEQVASAAAQISDIEARISALKTAGLNVTPCTRFSRFKPKAKTETINSSRQHRRKLPAPPVKDEAAKLELQLGASQA